jgi:hypothetical protein
LSQLHLRDLAAPALLQHPATVQSIRRALRGGLTVGLASMAAGLQGDLSLLPAVREVFEGSEYDGFRLQAALAIALLAPDTVDSRIADAVARGWSPHIAAHENTALTMALLLRALGRRIGRATDGQLARVARAVRSAVENRAPEDEAVRRYRAGGNPSAAWIFVIRDLRDAARAEFAA